MVASLGLALFMNFDFLSFQFLDNQISDYLLALVIWGAGMFWLKIFRTIAINRLKKLAARTDNIYDDVIIRIIERNVIPIAYMGIIYVAVSNLTWHPILARVLEAMVIMASTILAIVLLATSGEYLMRLYGRTYHQDNAQLEQSINALYQLAF